MEFFYIAGVIIIILGTSIAYYMGEQTGYEHGYNDGEEVGYVEGYLDRKAPKRDYKEKPISSPQNPMG